MFESGKSIKKKQIIVTNKTGEIVIMQKESDSSLTKTNVLLEKIKSRLTFYYSTFLCLFGYLFVNSLMFVVDCVCCIVKWFLVILSSTYIFCMHTWSKRILEDPLPQSNRICWLRIHVFWLSNVRKLYHWRHEQNHFSIYDFWHCKLVTDDR